MKKIGLFFGGPSNEHEVSITSAKNIVKNFDYQKFKLVLIYWDKKGVFHLIKDINKLNLGKILNLKSFNSAFDIALLMTHGKNGEDGILQSLLESQGIKYCGCRPLSSALCMDKGLFKQYLLGQKIKQVKFTILDHDRDTKKEIETKILKLKSSFKLPAFIKPANSGSSVGITKIDNYSQIKQAISEALKHDRKIIIEAGLVNPREIEVAVMGNKDLIISSPGELRLAKEFYNYDDKYKLGETKVIIPAPITAKQKREITALAKKVYKLCDCTGLARVDFFIANKKIYVNEINTLPGFTNISMFPMLMMDKNFSYQELINKIISLAY